MTRASRLVTTVVVAMVVLAACGDDDGPAITGTLAPTTTAAATTTTAAGAGGAATTAAATTTTAAGAGGAATTVAPVAGATFTVRSTSIGGVLADGNGRTLYVFTMDAPDESNCTGGCLATWPRYTPATVAAGPGVEASALGTITVDGAQQATIARQPLYYFSGDTAPGDVKGQGVGGNWWVVAPEGTPIED